MSVKNRGTAEKRKFFDAAAGGWKVEISEKEDGILRECFSQILQFRSGSNFILDIGCGTGILFPYLVGWKIIGLDFSYRMLDRAKKGAPSALVGLVNADAQFLPFRDETFDHVIFFSAIPHIEDKFLAILESHRLHKAGGTIAILHLKEGDKINAIHSSVGGPIGKDVLPEIEELSQVVNKAGFSIIERHSRDYYFLHGRKSS